MSHSPGRNARSVTPDGGMDAVFETYDRMLAAESDLECRTYYQSCRDKFRMLGRAVDLASAAAVLEIGTSEFSFLLKASFPEQRMVSLNLAPAESRWHPHALVEQVVGDLTRPPLPLDDAQFDVILFSEVLEHLQGNPRVAFAELLRLLKPGGRLVLTTPNLARLTSRLRLLLGRSPLERIGPPGWLGHIREYTRAEVGDFLQAAGFEVERLEFDLYFDGIGLYLDSGPRGFDDQGQFYYRPRFRGPLRVLAYPLVWAFHRVVSFVPSLRGGLVAVARRPA